MMMRPCCFGRYILVDRLARGGMGEVYVAVGGWGREKLVALKKILPALSREPEFRARFQDEARLVIPMSHPNVVQVFEVGRAGDEYFIAMEFIEGPNLGEFLAALCRQTRRRLPVTAALYVIRELLAGLDYCHHQTDSRGLHLGVVHRDVSPSNVLLSYDGAVKLADFGLALSRFKAYQTQPDRVLGHLGYMAPEAMDGKRVDFRADIYCAGVLLFEMLTCQRFIASDDPVVVRQMLHQRGEVRPSVVRGDLPPDVDALVVQSTARNPEQRYHSARAFLEAVQRVLIRIDALYDARSLAQGVMRPLFNSAHQKQQLRQRIAGLDLEEIEAGQPARRTVCIGEAIPLTLDTQRRREAPVLTFIEGVFEGDTEPMESIWSQNQTDTLDDDVDQQTVQASRPRLAESQVRSRRPVVARRTWPARSRVRPPRVELTPPPRWLEAESRH